MENRIKIFLSALPREAIAFFVVFSRFEYALKCSGYVKNKFRAEANWDRFSKTLGDSFFKQVKNSKIAETLLKKPPQKQIIKNGKLDWEASSKITSVHELFVMIRQVRNNLFHGGKFPHPKGPVPQDPEREKALLIEAQNVLEKALEDCPKLESVFFGLD